jgi:hypothetical protein
MHITETSDYVPCTTQAAPIPKWKTFPEFREVLPPGDPAGE